MQAILYGLGALIATVVLFGSVARWAVRGEKPRGKMPAAKFGGANGKTNGKTNGKNHGNRVLVAFASKQGSTADAALVIGQKLAEKGVLVDVKPVDEDTDISAYDAFVLGAAVRAARPTTDYLDFVKRNAAELSRKPTAIFLVCMTLAKDTPENRRTVESYFDGVRLLIRPKAEGYFAGRIVYGRLNPLTRLVARTTVNAGEGDFMNKTEMERWAEGVSRVILPA